LVCRTMRTGIVPFYAVIPIHFFFVYLILSPLDPFSS